MQSGLLTGMKVKRKRPEGKRPDTTKQYCFEFQGDLIDIM